MEYGKQDEMPKKRVTFTGVCEKENLYAAPKPQFPLKDSVQHVKIDSQIIELQERLTSARVMSAELKKTNKLKFTAYNVVGLR